MNKKTTTSHFSPEVRERAVRLVLDHRGEYASQWAALCSISGKIGCTAETLRLWMKRAERGGGAAEGAGAGEPGTAPSERDSSQGFRVFCPGGARPPVQTMIAFIDDHRGAYGVEPICEVLPIAPSTYHAHVARRRDPDKASARDRRDAHLRGQIQRVVDDNFRVYGVRKVWRQLKREGKDVARCTVARLMRDMGLQGVVRGKPAKTTIGDRSAPCPLDKVNRQFQAPRPNALWVSDFTYVATWQGFVYVAFVIDAFARRIVGWRASRTAHAGFVLDALEQALHNRRPIRGGGLVHHSDRGVQYLSIKYSERLTEAGLEPSVGSYDNALAETINGRYKAEVVHRRGPWRNFQAVEFATLEWVDWFNNRRLLEPIGNILPAEAEERYYAQKRDHAMAA